MNRRGGGVASPCPDLTVTVAVRGPICDTVDGASKTTVVPGATVPSLLPELLPTLRFPSGAGK